MISVRILLLAFILLLPAISPAQETREISFTFKSADPVIFSHEFHLPKYNNTCKICHNAIFNLKEKKHFTMAEMERLNPAEPAIPVPKHSA